jgi:hypothetical protein
MKNLLYMMKSIPMNFGIEGTLISTIKHCLFSKRWLKEYQNYSLHMKEFAKDVLLERISRSHSQSNNRSKQILDLIHSDVCGPMPVKYLGGSLYYVIFIDDYSRKTWLYLVKTKDEVFSKFQEFKVEIKNLTNKKIKTLRTDNGGEYTSKEFVSFCKLVGIRRELIVPHNPQQNGVAERKNKSIEETVKELLNN